MPDDRWPLLPLALSGKTYFVLDQTRLLTGVPEDPQDYISFCRANGVFRQKPVPVPTHAEAWHDALALRRSPTWKSLKWKYHDKGTTYDMDKQTVWDCIKAQADAAK